MKSFLNSLKLAFADSYLFLENLPGRLWIPFFLSFIFLGWNGLQILFSPNLILAFVDTRSVTHFVFRTLEYSAHAVPVYIFIVLTFIIIHWVFHCIFETGFTHLLHQQKIRPKKISAVGFNFFIPNLIIVILILFIVTSFFMMSIFLQIIFSGSSLAVSAGMETVIYRIVGLSFFLAIVTTMWLGDFVLPRMALGSTFKDAFSRSLIILNSKPFTFLSFYLIKLFLILLSITLFRIILRHLLLPFFIMLRVRYSFSLIFISSRELNFENLFANLGIVLIVLIASLMVFAPVLAPLYVYQRFLLKRLTRV